MQSFISIQHRTANPKPYPGVFFTSPAAKKNDLVLGLGCAALFIAFWLDKGIGFVLAGFVPTPLHEITEYIPAANELGITIGIWATGLFIVTVLYKIAIGVEHEVEKC